MLVSGDVVPENSVLLVFADGKSHCDRQIIQMTDRVRIGLDELHVFWQVRIEKSLGRIA